VPRALDWPSRRVQLPGGCRWCSCCPNKRRAHHSTVLSCVRSTAATVELTRLRQTRPCDQQTSFEPNQSQTNVSLPLSCLGQTTGSVSAPIAMMPAPCYAGAGLARAMARAGSVAGRRAVATYAIRPQEALLRELWAQQHEHQPKVSQVGSPSCGIMHEHRLWHKAAQPDGTHA
jgi:hypothetical protein